VSSPSRSTPTSGEPPASSIAPGALAEDLLSLWGRRKSRAAEAPSASRAPGSPSQHGPEPPGGPALPEGPSPRRRRSQAQGSPTEATDLARAIRLLRGERTQAAVAEVAGLDPGIWSQYETGRRRPREKNLARIVAALGCSRLELEEAVWQLRRQRLGPPEAGAQEGEASGLLAEVIRFTQTNGAREQETGEPMGRAEALPSPPSPLGAQERATADPVRQELRAILRRFAAVLEDLLMFLLRARRGAVSGATATKQGQPTQRDTRDEPAEAPRVARAG